MNSSVLIISGIAVGISHIAFSCDASSTKCCSPVQDLAAEQLKAKAKALQALVLEIAEDPEEAKSRLQEIDKKFAKMSSYDLKVADLFHVPRTHNAASSCCSCPLPRPNIGVSNQSTAIMHFIQSALSLSFSIH